MLFPHVLFRLIASLPEQVRQWVSVVQQLSFVEVALLTSRAGDEDTRPASLETKDDKDVETPSLFTTLFLLHPEKERIAH